MAVHVPLSEEAQEEARDIMVSSKNLMIPRTGDPVVNPSQDIVLGCYFMTRVRPGAEGEGKCFSSPNEAIIAYDFGYVDLQAMIKVATTSTPKYQIFEERIVETTVGRLLFNSVLPHDFSFINEEFTKKKLARLVEDLIGGYGVEAVPEILDKIKEFGYQYATKSGISWGMCDLREPVEKKAIIKEAEDSFLTNIDNNQAVLIAQIGFFDPESLENFSLQQEKTNFMRILSKKLT